MAIHRRLVFLLTPPALLLAAHFYVALRLGAAQPQAPSIVWGCLALMYAGITAGFLIRHDRSTTVNDVVSWMAFCLLGLFSWLFVLTLIRDVVLLLLWGLGPWLGPLLPKAWSGSGTLWATNSALGVIGLSVVATVIGFFNARRTPAVKTVTVTIADLPPALHGFSLAQITDLHIGPTIKKDFVRRVVQRTNNLQADVIVLTGDLIDGDVAGLRPHTQPLAKLAAPFGVFAVTGNHEYYSGARQWVEEYKRLGMQVLENEHVVLTINSVPMVLAGVTDYDAERFDGARRSDPKAALRGSPAEAALKILLAHQPRSMWAAAKAGFDVQLSGHTHGGQFWPWGHFVRLQQPFVAGLHRYQQLQVYISRGTGYWGPPLRFGARAEISLIRLQAQ